MATVLSGCHDPPSPHSKQYHKFNLPYSLLTFNTSHKSHILSPKQNTPIYSRVWSAKFTSWVGGAPHPSGVRHTVALLTPSSSAKLTLGYVTVIKVAQYYIT